MTQLPRESFAFVAGAQFRVAFSRRPRRPSPTHDELRKETAEFCKLVYGELLGKVGTDPLKREELRIAIRLRLNPNPERRPRQGNSQCLVATCQTAECRCQC
jgi:hypothetical protein